MDNHFHGYWKNMDMDSWITGSLDTVKYGLILIALHRLDSILPKTDWEIGS
jgi:hypothetical protein